MLAEKEILIYSPLSSAVPEAFHLKADKLDIFGDEYPSTVNVFVCVAFLPLLSVTVTVTVLVPPPTEITFDVYGFELLVFPIPSFMLTVLIVDEYEPLAVA